MIIIIKNKNPYLQCMTLHMDTYTIPFNLYFIIESNSNIFKFWRCAFSSKNRTNRYGVKIKHTSVLKERKEKKYQPSKRESKGKQEIDMKKEEKNDKQGQTVHKTAIDREI